MEKNNFLKHIQTEESSSWKFHIMPHQLAQKRLSYPRVSDIIGKQTKAEFDAIPADVLSRASERGTKVHSYCAIYAKGLWLPDIEEECQPYFDAFVQWYDENVEELLYEGARLYDDEKCFSGEFDMIVRLKDSKKIALLDLKTSANVSKTWALQLAAYKHLCELNGYLVEIVLNIHLKKCKPSGVKPLPIEHEDLKPSWEIFTSALKCYDFFDRKKIKTVEEISNVH